MNDGLTHSWPAIATRIMNGEFDDAMTSERESLIMGLRSSEGIICKQAVMRLERIAENKGVVKKSGKQMRKGESV